MAIINFYFSSLGFINKIIVDQIKQIIGCNHYYMQEQGQSSNKYYRIKKKLTIKESELYKLIQFDEHRIMFAAPGANCVVVMEPQLSGNNLYQCQFDSPSALDLVNLGGKKFVIVGNHKGLITVKQVDQRTVGQNQQIQFIHQWNLAASVPQQIYINDIAHHPSNPSVILNCYNNGDISAWGLLTQKRLHTFERVHQKFTYKIRFQSINILVSCGNDTKAIRTDLQKQKSLSFYPHPCPVWCAYPIDSHQIATVGLFGRVLVWDARSNRVVQSCSNKGQQSSFITSNQPKSHELFYGDTSMLFKWDRRAPKPHLITSHRMNQSAESILFHRGGLYACGRGKDICWFQAEPQFVQSSDQYLNEQLSLGKTSETGKQDSFELEAIADMDSDRDDQEASVSEDQGQQQISVLQQVTQNKENVTIISVSQLSQEKRRQHLTSQLKWLGILAQQEEAEGEKHVQKLKVAQGQSLNESGERCLGKDEAEKGRQSESKKEQEEKIPEQ